MPNLSFTTSGATPGISGGMDTPFNTKTQPIQYSTPAANALNGATTPSTPVKKQTTQSPDGTVNTVEYHPPTQTDTSAPASSAGTTSGLLPNASPTYNQYTGTTAATPSTGNNNQVQTNSNDQAVNTSTPGALPSNAFQQGVSGLLNTQNSPYNTAATNYETSTANYGAGNIPIGQNAAGIAAQYGQQIANVGQKGAQFESGQFTTGTSPVAEGNAAVTAQTTAAQQQALATGESAALQGTQQQLTAQDQAANATNQAAGASNTGQSNVQGATGAATTATAPQQNYPFVFNPSTGTYTNASTGGMVTPEDAANAVLNGQLSYSDAATALGYLGNTGTAQLQSAILTANPNANLNTLQGQASGQQAVGAAGGQTQASNIQTAGTTATDTASAGYKSSAAAYNDFQNNVVPAANAQASQVQSILSSTGLNSGVPDYNKAINSLSGKLGSTQVTQLTSSLTELQNMYQGILNTSSTPTASEEQALSVLNPNSSAAQINAAIGQLQTAAYNRSQGLYTELQTYSNNLNGGGSTSSSSSGGSVSYDF